MNPFLLLIALNICHFAADYTHLATNTMLRAKKQADELFPIYEHALIHSVLFGLVLIYPMMRSENLVIFYQVLFFELITHFFIDVLKGKLNFWFPRLANSQNRYHWYVFGADQFLHQLVIILIVWYITK